jgi:hypothetical protein
MIFALGVPFYLILSLLFFIAWLRIGEITEEPAAKPATQVGFCMATRAGSAATISHSKIVLS